MRKSLTRTVLRTLLATLAALAATALMATNAIAAVQVLDAANGNEPCTEVQENNGIVEDGCAIELQNYGMISFNWFGVPAGGLQCSSSVSARIGGDGQFWITDFDLNGQYDCGSVFGNGPYAINLPWQGQIDASGQGFTASSEADFREWPWRGTLVFDFEDPVWWTTDGDPPISTYPDDSGEPYISEGDPAGWIDGQFVQIGGDEMTVVEVIE